MTVRQVAVLALALVLMLGGSFPVSASFECIDYMDVVVPEPIDAVQWFPCREGYEDDDLWEAQCTLEQDGATLAQRFTESAEDTGYTNFLDTARNVDGSLTVTRNGADGVEGVYAPYVRTLLVESVPSWSMDGGNTLHFDFEATDGWSIVLNFALEHTIILDKAIAQACGAELVDGVGAAGRYTGSLNLDEALRAMASQNDAAAAVLAMGEIPVPQLTIHCIGEVGSALTMRKWLVSTPEDSEGAYCYFACMGLMTGISYPMANDCFPRVSMPTEATVPTTVPQTQSPVTGNATLPIVAAVAVVVAAVTALVYVVRKAARS